MADMVGLDAFARRIDALQRDLDPDRMSRMQRELGDNAQRLAEREASADLGGDPKFSGWAPMLETKWRPLSGGAIGFSPTRSSAGPWTVAERGRNQGNAGGFAGPAMTRTGGAVGRTKSGGVRRTRARASRRWNGRTEGKGTASRVVAAIESTTPPIVDRHVVIVTRKHFDVD